jgi:hypothetical protein
MGKGAMPVASGDLPRRFRRPLFTQDQWPQAIFWSLVFVVIGLFALT